MERNTKYLENEVERMKALRREYLQNAERDGLAKWILGMSDALMEEAILLEEIECLNHNN